MANDDKSLTIDLSELKLIDELLKPNEIILEYSKKTDPLFMLLAASHKIGKRQELQALLENCAANWLSNNKEVYDIIPNISLNDVYENAMFNIYNHECKLINETLDTLIIYIQQYFVDGTYWLRYENGEITGIVNSEITNILSVINNESYEKLSYVILAELLNRYINNSLYDIVIHNSRDEPLKSIIPKEYLNKSYGLINPISELTDKISSLLNKINLIHIYTEIIDNSSKPVFSIEFIDDVKWFCLGFEYFDINKLSWYITNFSHPIWNYVNSDLLKNNRGGKNPYALKLFIIENENNG